jgi:hypothetical protein
MKKMLLLAACLLVVGTAWAKPDTLKYRISLTDKAATTYSLSRPEEFLSLKALQRRARQHIAVDSTDLPVCRAYINEIVKCGVRVVLVGKWDNFVTVACNDSTRITQITRLPFVRSVEKVWQAFGKPAPAVQPRDTLSTRPIEPDESVYGYALAQIKLSNGDKLHEASFRGEGMTIAVTDGGFHNVDRITVFRNTRIVGMKDFVDPHTDICAEGGHGMKVLSCMGMNEPHVMIGTAPEASYWLFRTEDDHSESLVEQDYWAAAVEFADSVGVDIINTSLGYYAFDDKSKNYDYCQLDGHYSLISRQASRLAGKGMVLVCSAGNAGRGSWKKITPPGDADNVLTVGAIDRAGVLAPFSSVGNTADGRVKPDVVAVGVASDIISTSGRRTQANGTSFASPILCGMVACLWQACPTLTAKELIELVRRSGNRADCPDNIYGYGIPDFWKAYTTWKEQSPFSN